MNYRNNRYFLLIACTTLFLQGCDQLKSQRKSDQEPVVARVGQSALLRGDIESLTDNLFSNDQGVVSPSDSANLVNRYVQNWVMQRLMLQEATDKLEYDAAEIDRKVEDYRFALMINKFKNFYVNQYLESDISNEEIQNYYDENKQNFILKKKNIVKAMMLKIPKNAPVLDNIRSLAVSDSEGDWQELNDYGRKFAANFVRDSIWYNFSQLVANTPWQNMGNETQFLRSRKYDQINDEDFRYFLRIYDYKLADEFSPLEYVKEDIYKIILNRRKVELTRQLEENIYRNAEKEGKFKIY